MSAKRDLPLESAPDDAKDQPAKKPRSTEDEEGGDVLVIVGGKEFRADSRILKAFSEYFDAAFRSGMKEAQEKRFEFPDLDPKSWETLMKLLDPFDSRVSFSPKVCENLLPLVDFLNMKKALKKCDEVLSKIELSATFKQAVSYLEKSFKYDLKATNEECLWIIRNYLGSNIFVLELEDLKKVVQLMHEYQECRESLNWEVWDQLLPKASTSTLPTKTRKEQFDAILDCGLLAGIAHSNMFGRKFPANRSSAKSSSRAAARRHRISSAP